jgi:pre-mRNA-processing factor 40
LQAKESFLALLDSCESLKEAVRIDPHHKANFTIATELLSSEPQWSVVDQPRSFFDEWVEEKMEEEKEKKRIENRKRCENFARYLKTVDWINVKTSWREAEQRLTGVFEFEGLQEDLVGRLEVWQDHMAEVEEQERKERELYAIEQRRQERLNREEFKRKVLSLHRERGVLHHKMRWREYYAMISGEPALRAVEDNLRGSRPKELFMDMIEELEHEAVEAVGIVDQKLAGLPEDKVAEVIRASVAVPCDEFWQLISSFKLDLNLDLEHNNTTTWRQGVWWEFKSRVMREQQRKAERFKDFLRSTNEINASTTFEQAAEICGNEAAWKEGSVDDDGRRRLFGSFITEKKELGLELEAEAQLRLSRKRRRKREKFSGEYDSYSDHSDRSSDDSPGGARRNEGGGGGHRRRRRYDKYSRHRRRSRSRSLDRGRSKRYGFEKKKDKEAHDSDREVEEGEVR